ncbi:MAG: SMP-30/gluconolactonase/LRE family protein, partial [Candidatus Binatia bacterium]
TPVPWPSEAWQHERSGSPYFQSILSLRIDRQRRLWVLDFADYGRGQPRLVAFDIDSGELVHQYDFPAEVAGLGSMLNDLQIDPAGETIYIAETSPIVQRPALVVYDVIAGTSRRVLDGHASVKAKNFLINAVGRDMRIYGLLALRIGVDSIALDRRGEYLYYGPVNGDRLYRIATRDLDNTGLGDEELANRVEDFAAKTLSDGLTTDDADNVYITDMEHSAILRLSPDGRLETLLKDARLRWPDGFSFGPDGWLYVTCSSLHHVLFVSKARMRANAPYHVYRFRPGATAVAGH